MSEATVAARVARGGAARAAGYVAGTIVSTVGAVLLLRHLGLVDFGRYGTVIALLTIVQGLTEAGLTTVATRDMALLTADARGELLRHLVGLRLLLGAAGVAAAVAFAAIAGYDSTMVAGTAIAGVGVALISAQAAVLVPLTVELRNGRVALNELLRQVLLTLGVVAFTVAGSRVAGYFLNQALAAAALVALTPLIVGRAGLVLPRFEPARAVALLRAAAPLALATALGTVYVRVLVVLCSLLTGATETAKFVTSNRLFELLLGLPLLMSGVILPVLSVAAREDPGRLRYVNQRLLEVAFLAGMACAIGLVVGAQPILAVLGGDQYTGVEPVLRLQAPVILTLFLASAFTPGLIVRDRQRALAVVIAASLVTAVVAGLLLIPPLDAQGAALAAVLAELVSAGGAFVALRHAGPGRDLTFAWLPRALLAAGLAFAAGLLCPGPAAVATVVALAVYVALLFALRLVPTELLELLPR